MAKNPSAYLAAIPKKAAIHIQNSAPGPPVLTARATPTMFPVPTVADKAVQRDAKFDISPIDLLDASLFFSRRYFIACFKRKNCKKFNLKEKYMLTNARIEINGIPQIVRLIIVIKLSIRSIKKFLLMLGG
jgi:hypothetical protein